MLIFWVWVFYGVPSLALVIFFIFFLRRQEFHHSFYRVLQCDMVINIFCYLNTWIPRLCHVESTIPFMIHINNNFYFIFHINCFFDSFFYNAQSMSVIVISAHRLWCLMSTYGTEFWKRNYGYVYGGIVFFCGVLTFLNVGLGVYRPVYYAMEQDAFVKLQVDQSKTILANQIFLTKGISFFTILLFINIWTLYLLVKQFYKKLNKARIRTMFKTLTFIAFLNSFIFFVIMLAPIGQSYIFKPEDYFYNSMVTSDLLSLSLPYILLACDKNVQATLSKLKLFGPKQSVHPIATGSVVNGSVLQQGNALH